MVQPMTEEVFDTEIFACICQMPVVKFIFRIVFYYCSRVLFYFLTLGTL